MTALLGAWGIAAQGKQTERTLAAQRSGEREARIEEKRASVYVEALSELGRWSVMRRRDRGDTASPPLVVRDHEQTIEFTARLAAFGSREARDLWDEWVRIGVEYEAARKVADGGGEALGLLGELGSLVGRFRDQVATELQHPME